MEQCDKVILFGYLDGYTYELNGITNYVVALETGERVEIPVGGVISVDEFVKKDKIKLKDVIARIKKLDLGTQKVWLNEILNELGSDYGTLKYKAGYEQGKLEGEWVNQQLKDADKIRQEINKPVVPQFAADFITEQKKLGHTLSYSIDACMSDIVAEWYWDNSELFARAWLDGYEVEKEKRYIVKVKGVRESHNYLNHHISLDSWFFNGESEPLDFRVKHTRKELEEAGFDWVFDCPGIELEEVENE